ncbi:MAG TPA: helix-turn-helix transcriptional regulator [Candidatus Elarobacter sp.]
METIGERMRRIRVERGIGVPDLASTVGVSPGAIRQIESGQIKSPGLLLGVRIADALGIDPRHLALGEHASTNERFADLDKRLRKVERFIAESPKRRR